MKAHLSRRYRFSASHRLHAPSLNSEQNLLTYGKCNNPFGHGHNYVVTVTFSGEIDANTGMVTNLADLDDFAQKNLVGYFDRRNLNTLMLFEHLVPTTENLTLAIYEIFALYPNAKLERVHVEETSNNSFEYSGSNPPKLDVAQRL